VLDVDSSGTSSDDDVDQRPADRSLSIAKPARLEAGAEAFSLSVSRGTVSLSPMAGTLGRISPLPSISLGRRSSTSVLIPNHQPLSPSNTKNADGIDLDVVARYAAEQERRLQSNTSVVQPLQRRMRDMQRRMRLTAATGGSRSGHETVALDWTVRATARLAPQAIAPYENADLLLEVLQEHSPALAARVSTVSTLHRQNLLGQLHCVARHRTRSPELQAPPAPRGGHSSPHGDSPLAIAGASQGDHSFAERSIADDC
jgi:hypothetical protein